MSSEHRSIRAGSKKEAVAIGFRLVDPDIDIFREIERWRVVTGKHIGVLADFSGQRSCDRRLKKLIEAGYLERKKILYGVPGIYRLTHPARILIGVSERQDRIRLEQISHDIEVLNTAIWIHQSRAIPFSEMQTEKQLHSLDGFSNRRHRPDFIFAQDGKTICVEVELSLKSKERLQKNIKLDFETYDAQIWIVPDRHSKITAILQENQNRYPGIEIIEIEEVKNHA